MELIRENVLKKRKVYHAKTFIRKYWVSKDLQWVKNHARLLETIMPDYVIQVGQDGTGVYLDMKIVSGISADQFPHTVEFVRKIHKFCLQHIEQTHPYVHGDWTLSNIIIDGDKMSMVDWDNVGIYPTSDVELKLKNDLVSAFGDLYFEAIDDSTSI
jgi:hypothetical protein